MKSRPIRRRVSWMPEGYRVVPSSEVTLTGDLIYYKKQHIDTTSKTGYNGKRISRIVGNDMNYQFLRKIS